MRALSEIWTAVALAALALLAGALLALRLGAAQPAIGEVLAANSAGRNSAQTQGLIQAKSERQPKEKPAADEPADAKDEQEGEELSDETIEKRKAELSAEQNYVCFQKGTEPPFSGKYYDNHEHGMYICVVCSNPLFASDTKFDSGTGWPSFWEMAEEGHVATHEDRSHGMLRTEVTCAKCGSHLGHVFDDGPKPTGLRYCINSLSLDFIPAEQWAKREKSANEETDSAPESE